MRLYIREKIESKEKAEELFLWLNVIRKENSYTFELYEKEKKSSSFTVAEDELEIGVTYNLRLSNENGTFFGKEDTRYQLFERYAGLFFVQSGCNVKFYKHSESDELIVMTNYSTLLEGGETAEIYIGGFTQLLLQQYPDYGKIKKARALRKDLVYGIHANDSLSYFEAQLDFITVLLLQMIEMHPEKDSIVKMFSDYIAFKEALISYNVFSIKPEESCLEEIIGGKSRVRKAQESYYEEKYS